MALYKNKTLSCFCFVTARGSDGSTVFSFFLRLDDNSRTAALSSMKFRMNMYLDNCYKPVEFEGRRPKVKVAWFFCAFLSACYCDYDTSLEQGLTSTIWFLFHFKSISRSIKTHLYSAICPERIRGAFCLCWSLTCGQQWDILQ